MRTPHPPILSMHHHKPQLSYSQSSSRHPCARFRVLSVRLFACLFLRFALHLVILARLSMSVSCPPSHYSNPPAALSLHLSAYFWIMLRPSSHCPRYLAPLVFCCLAMATAKSCCFSLLASILVDIGVLRDQPCVVIDRTADKPL